MNKIKKMWGDKGDLWGKDNICCFVLGYKLYGKLILVELYCLFIEFGNKVKLWILE